MKPKVAPFTGKIEYNSYSKAVCNSMCKKQEMQVRKPCEQQGIKPITKQLSAEARIAALEAQVRTNSQLEEGDVKWTE